MPAFLEPEASISEAGSSKYYKTSCFKQPETPKGVGNLSIFDAPSQGHHSAETEALSDLYCLIECKRIHFSPDPWIFFYSLLFFYT